GADEPAGSEIVRRGCSIFLGWNRFRNDAHGDGLSSRPPVQAGGVVEPGGVARAVSSQWIESRAAPACHSGVEECLWEEYAVNALYEALLQIQATLLGLTLLEVEEHQPVAATSAGPAPYGLQQRATYSLDAILFAHESFRDVAVRALHQVGLPVHID